MKTKLLAACAGALALAAAASAAAGKSPVSYWTAAQADTAVIAQATTPECLIFPNQPGRCANGTPIPGVAAHRAVVRYSDCVGEAGFSSAGRFSRFICKVQSNNQVGNWTLEVFTAGPSTIRWRRI